MWCYSFVPQFRYHGQLQGYSCGINAHSDFPTYPRKYWVMELRN